MAQAAATADPVDAKKSGNMKIIIAVVAALAIGMGATWFLLGGKKSGDHSEPVAAKPMPAMFFPLETFTVNLIPEFGDQYLQVEITLKFTSQSNIDDLKARMPEVRNRVLYLLSSKRASELTTVAGKSALASGIREQLNMLIDPMYKPAPVPLQRHAAGGEDQGGATGHDPMSDRKSHDPVATTVHPAVDSQHAGPVYEVLFTSFIIQ